MVTEEILELIKSGKQLNFSFRKWRDFMAHATGKTVYYWERQYFKAVTELISISPKSIKDIYLTGCELFINIPAFVNRSNSLRT